MRGEIPIRVGTNMTKSYFGMVPTTCPARVSERGDTD